MSERTSSAAHGAHTDEPSGRTAFSARRPQLRSKAKDLSHSAAAEELADLVTFAQDLARGQAGERPDLVRIRGALCRTRLCRGLPRAEAEQALRAQARVPRLRGEVRPAIGAALGFWQAGHPSVQ
jgi:hypothetical protein